MTDPLPRWVRLSVALSLVLVTGCTPQPDDAAHNRVAARVLQLFNWNNYIAPETIERFEAACDCHVEQDYFSDNEEMLAKLAAGATGYDLIVPTGNAMDTLIRQGVLIPLDNTLLPNLKNIHPAYLKTRFDPDNRYSVPYAYTLTLLGFNANKMRELGLPVDTWALIFEPEYLKKIKGRVTVLDSPRELMAAALLYLGHAANDQDETHWNQAKELIIRAKPYWAAFSNTSYIREIAIGDLWVVHGYSNDLFQAALDAQKTGRHFTIDYAIPKEGAVMSLDSMVLHKSGKHPDLAHQFINFMLDGRNSAELTNLIGSGNPNVAAKPFIRPELVHNNVIFPDEETSPRLEMITDLNHKQRRVLSRMWTEIKLR
ncbi:MAG: spermidine/putrescine ABC transporter substrate-binding protein [Nitrosomonas sp.]|nr:MAG: spermidine/putrescine ABC transporter substrate-binding protein [Nitrosomonas sp.]